MNKEDLELKRKVYISELEKELEVVIYKHNKILESINLELSVRIDIKPITIYINDKAV